MNKRMDIDVDRLVLHGIPPGQRRGARAAVERELARIGTQGEITAGQQLQIQLPREGKLS